MIGVVITFSSLSLLQNEKVLASKTTRKSQKHTHYLEFLCISFWWLSEGIRNGGGTIPDMTWRKHSSKHWDHLGAWSSFLTFTL